MDVVDCLIILYFYSFLIWVVTLSFIRQQVVGLERQLGMANLF